ncbi:hypothetical protein D3C77_565580 [compost metagenome]
MAGAVHRRRGQAQGAEILRRQQRADAFAHQPLPAVPDVGPVPQHMRMLARRVRIQAGTANHRGLIGRENEVTLLGRHPRVVQQRLAQVVARVLQRRCGLGPRQKRLVQHKAVDQRLVHPRRQHRIRHHHHRPGRTRHHLQHHACTPLAVHPDPDDCHKKFHRCDILSFIAA